MDNAAAIAALWQSNGYFDENTRAEVKRLSGAERAERFGCDLEFGTAGMRGVMGAGSNRMNIYTVRKASFGFARYMKERFGADAARGIAVGYDTRLNSYEFALETALVFCAQGVKARLFSEVSPVPELSFAVRHYGCVGGVMITASHNPKEYNGYKAYDEKGCQLVPELAERLTECVEAISDITVVHPMQREQAEKSGLLTYIGTEADDAFCRAVLEQGSQVSGDVKVMYTPLHGSGSRLVRRVLRERGFDFVTVPEQEVPDGSFPTVCSPNPEDKKALELGIALAKKQGADIVVGTDPDCDRVGAAVNTGADFELLSGNQVGALLVNYLAPRAKNHEKPVAVKTVVTSELGAVIAAAHGIEMVNTLTGFKYIGEQMERFLSDGRHFLIGYEESYGYLVGCHARDKDGVVSTMLICEMAAFYKAQGKNLKQVLRDIYEKYGYYLDTQDSFTLAGADGQRKIKAAMSAMRAAGTALLPGCVRFSDYLCGADGLPRADVLKYFFADGSWTAVRPSGTEPKIKIYYSVRGENEAAASRRLEDIRKIMRACVSE